MCNTCTILPKWDGHPPVMRTVQVERFANRTYEGKVNFLYHTCDIFYCALSRQC